MLYIEIDKKSIQVSDVILKERTFNNHSVQRIERIIHNGNILVCGHFIPLAYSKFNSKGFVHCTYCYAFSLKGV